MKKIDKRGMELLELRINLIDLVSPYGLFSDELLMFDDEVSSLVGLDPEIQRKSLKKLAGKIKAYYKKQKRE